MTVQIIKRALHMCVNIHICIYTCILHVYIFCASLNSSPEQLCAFSTFVCRLAKFPRRLAKPAPILTGKPGLGRASSTTRAFG